MGQLSVTAPPESVGMSSSRLARIRPFFESQYVSAGKLPGMITLVARRGEVVSLDCFGPRDVESGAPTEPDTLFRIYSMTKPITSVALMTLHEESAFQLDDPVSRYLPELKGLRVWEDGTPFAYRTKPAERDITVRDLLTHTAGFTYGFMFSHPVDALYRKRGVEGRSSLGPPEGPPLTSLADMIDRLAELPLLFSPGTRWSYSVATDVCGRLVEVLSGMALDEAFRTRIFEPLGMTDTGFWVDEAQTSRLAACYARTPGHPLLLVDPPATSRYRTAPEFLSGGGGLVSSAHDYLRFMRMLANGGELDGARILGPRTVRWMASNHLPTGGDLTSMGQRVFSETNYDGVGFGLGFSVTLDPVRAGVPGSAGDHGWGGAASTFFWIDPREELMGLLLTQLIPSSSYPIRGQLKTLAYAALTD
jgi:CubicO group peptidase (beta-lactamase class C family)